MNERQIENAQRMLDEREKDWDEARAARKADEKENLLNQEIWREESYRHSLQRFDQYIFTAVRVVCSDGLDAASDEDSSESFHSVIVELARSMIEAADKEFDRTTRGDSDAS